LAFPLLVKDHGPPEEVELRISLFFFKGRRLLFPPWRKGTDLSLQHSKGIHPSFPFKKERVALLLRGPLPPLSFKKKGKQAFRFFSRRRIFFFGLLDFSFVWKRDWIVSFWPLSLFREIDSLIFFPVDVEGCSFFPSPRPFFSLWYSDGERTFLFFSRRSLFFARFPP